MLLGGGGGGGGEREREGEGKEGSKGKVGGKEG